MEVKLTDGQTLHMQFTVEHPKRQHVTTCRLRLKNGDWMNCPMEVTSTATCYVRDKYNKVTGKVLALDRAMRSLRTFTGVCREDRKAVWARFYRAMAQSPDVQVMSGYGAYLGR